MAFGNGSFVTGGQLSIENVTVTSFNELLVASRKSQMNYKPTWGASSFRYELVETGAGSSAAETNGEFLLKSGTASSNVASITTNKRGQYRAGAVGQAGIGVRIPTSPTGTQEVKWGYSDLIESGFYFGEDSTGKFVAILTGGVETKTYQVNWNGDKLDGTGSSGLTLDYSKGVITHIDFTWYGYGTIQFSLFLYDESKKKQIRVITHTIEVNNSASITDPNQPLKFEVSNGTTTSTNLNFYVGGHQFSTYEGDFTPKSRSFSEVLSNYTTALNTDWQPLIAIRKKSTFNGRPNSVNVALKSLVTAGDGELEVRVTRDATTSNLTFSSPTGVPASETAVETKVTGETALTTSSDGTAIDYGFVEGSGNKQVKTISQNTKLELSTDGETVLWIRRLSPTGTIIVKHANLNWEESW